MYLSYPAQLSVRWNDNQVEIWNAQRPSGGYAYILYTYVRLIGNLAMDCISPIYLPNRSLDFQRLPNYSGVEDGTSGWSTRIYTYLHVHISVGISTFKESIPSQYWKFQDWNQWSSWLRWMNGWNTLVNPISRQWTGNDFLSSSLRSPNGVSGLWITFVTSIQSMRMTDVSWRDLVIFWLRSLLHTITHSYGSYLTM